jgi:adenosine deaminase
MTAAQPTLFNNCSDAALLHGINSLPKVDLHRHITGSITAETAVRVAAKYGVWLPTYDASELEEQLFGQSGVSTLREYFRPWELLNKLFVGRQATREIVLDIARRAADDRVAYVELRTGPRGFNGHPAFKFDEYLKSLVEATDEAESTYGTVIRWTLGIPRHNFIKQAPVVRARMCAQIFRTIAPLRPRYFVAVDLNGDETAAPPKEFRTCLHIASDLGFPVTVHAGECGGPEDVEYALNELHASRIGHGIAAARDGAVMAALVSKGCTLEICPTSNVFLRLATKTADLPIATFLANSVPFVICSDNPARCRTSISQELFRVAKAFGLSLADILRLTLHGVNAAFADDEAKTALFTRITAATSESRVWEDAQPALAVQIS